MLIKEEKKYVWFKQSMASNMEVIDCSIYNEIEDFHMDPSWFYVLIRINPQEDKIEVAICNKKHEIVKVFRGGKSQDLYYSIFEYEKKYNCEWFLRKDHVAYLGKELKKAELALLNKEDYLQE